MKTYWLKALFWPILAWYLPCQIKNGYSFLFVVPVCLEYTVSSFDIQPVSPCGFGLSALRQPAAVSVSAPSQLVSTFEWGNADHWQLDYYWEEFDDTCDFVCFLWQIHILLALFFPPIRVRDLWSWLVSDSSLVLAYVSVVLMGSVISWSLVLGLPFFCPVCRGFVLVFGFVFLIYLLQCWLSGHDVL